MTKSKPKPYQNKIQQVSRSFQKFYVEASQLKGLNVQQMMNNDAVWGTVAKLHACLYFMVKIWVLENRQ